MHDRDAYARTVHIAGAAERRAGRHQIAVIELENRRREIHLDSARRFDSQKCHVARVILQALDGLRRRRALDQTQLNAKTRRECAGNLNRDKSRADPA